MTVVEIWPHYYVTEIRCQSIEYYHLVSPKKTIMGGESWFSTKTHIYNFVGHRYFYSHGLP